MFKATRTTFKSLPREVRDSIYNFALVESHSLGQPLPRNSAIKGLREFRGYVQCIYTAGIGLGMSIQGLEPFLVLLHMWATRSSVAREACMAFYTNSIFYMSCNLLPHVLDKTTKWNALLEPDEFHLQSDPQYQRRLSRGINPIKYLRHLLVKIEASCSEIVLEEFKSVTSDALGRILELPNIKSVQIVLSTTLKHALDTCPTAAGVAAVAEVCTLLKERIGIDQESLKRITGLRCSTPIKGLSVEVWVRVFSCAINYYRYNITSLWNVPDDKIRGRMRQGVADWKEELRVLMADQPEDLLECLRDLL